MSNGEVSLRLSTEGEQKVEGTLDRVDAALKRFAARELRLNSRDVDQASDRIAKLDAALKKNLLTQEQYDAAVARSPLGKRVAAEKAKLDREVAQFAAAELKNQETALDRLLAKLKMADAALQAGKIDRQQHASIEGKYRDAYRSERFAARPEMELPQAVLPEKYVPPQASEEVRKLAARVKEIQTTPVERLTQKIKQLDEALKHNLLTVEQHRRAVKTAQDEHQRELDQTKAKLDETQKSGADAARGIAMGWEMAGGVMVGAAKAAGAAIVTTLSITQQKAEELKASVAGSVEELGALRQQAILDPKRYSELTKSARQVFATGAVPTLGEAAKVVRDIDAADEMKNLPLLVGLRRASVVNNIGEFAKAASSLQFSAGATAGNLPSLVAKGMVAASPSGVKSTTNVQDLIIGASKAGSQADVAKININELLAATSILATAKGGGDQGGERLTALLRSINKLPELQGMTLTESVTNLKSRGLDPDSLQKLIGSEEAIDALNILAGKMTELVEINRQVERADTGLVRKAISISEADPNVRAQVVAQQHRNVATLTGEVEGRRQLIGDAIIEANAADLRSGRRKGLVQAIAGSGSTTRSIDAALYQFVENGFLGFGARSIPGVSRRAENEFLLRPDADPELKAAIRANRMAERDLNQPQRNLKELERESRKIIDTGREPRDNADAVREREILRQQEAAAQKLLEAAEALQRTSAARSQSPAPRFDWINAARRDQAVGAE